MYMLNFLTIHNSAVGLIWNQTTTIFFYNNDALMLFDISEYNLHPAI